MRIAPLDAVRGGAAFAVAIPHFFMAKGILVETCESVSIVAVEVFFILSGFVLAPQLLFCFGKGDLGSLRVFYLRRWMRTIPPYLLALILISGIYGQLFSVDFFKYGFFVRNLSGSVEDDDYFFPAWSLAVEEWFYLVFPLVLLLKLRRSAIVTAAAFIGVFLAVKLAYVLSHPDSMPHLRRIVAFRLDAIAFGFVLYAALNGLASHWRVRIGRFAAFALIASTGAIAAILQLIGVQPLAWKELAFLYCAPVFGSALIALAFVYRDAVGDRTTASSLSFFAGRISYTVYLFHLPFLLIVNRSIPGGTAAQLAAYLVSLVLFCHLFFKYVERPILASRPDYKHGAAAHALA